MNYRGWSWYENECHKESYFATLGGTKIYAATPGTVTYAKFGAAPYSGYGNTSSLYSHYSKATSSQRRPSREAGTVIALVGSTGNHCHFEIRVIGNQVNPAQYLAITVK